MVSETARIRHRLRVCVPLNLLAAEGLEDGAVGTCGRDGEVGGPWPGRPSGGGDGVRPAGVGLEGGRPRQRTSALPGARGWSEPSDKVEVARVDRAQVALGATWSAIGRVTAAGNRPASRADRSPGGVGRRSVETLPASSSSRCPRSCSSAATTSASSRPPPGPARRSAGVGELAELLVVVRASPPLEEVPHLVDRMPASRDRPALEVTDERHRTSRVRRELGQLLPVVGLAQVALASGRCTWGTAPRRGVGRGSVRCDAACGSGTRASRRRGPAPAPRSARRRRRRGCSRRRRSGAARGGGPTRPRGTRCRSSASSTATMHDTWVSTKR